MKVIDFKKEHIKEAEMLACSDYDEQRMYVAPLPIHNTGINLTSFADNNFSVAAIDENKLVGFLCSFPPFEHAFGSTDITGVFSPMGANAAVKENREKIYDIMYQTAAEKWVKAGALSHAVCIPAHDLKLQREFYRLGFGLRCMDAIRKTDNIECADISGYDFVEIPISDYQKIYSLYTDLCRHYQKSPFFMNRANKTKEEFITSAKESDSRLFAAFHKGEICAYFESAKAGETYICNSPNYIHICGAYCLPQYRGKGIVQNLLDYMITALRNDGYTLLGVDFESINPTAYGFWTKYFTPYTHSVVRRIDEHILNGSKM
ncbi:MAG: GNAT family N-acetyltransferase [Oscillospiraceae bacterium]|nr:GNAT family N-acetyltransferase [Oscillospiraceae bacterium]